MKYLKFIPLALIMFVGTAYSKSYYQYDTLRYKASQLERASWRLANNMQYTHGYKHLSYKARSLARQAAYFKRSLNYRYSYRGLKRQFAQLKFKFNSLNTGIHQAYYRYNYRNISFNVRNVRNKFFNLQNKFYSMYGPVRRHYYSNRHLHW